MSLFYIGGMYLNDYFDRGIDARERPERPIPARDISAEAVAMIGSAMLASGAVLLGSTGLSAGAIGIALIAAIVVYDVFHKGNPVAPVVMGLCRAIAELTKVTETAGYAKPDGYIYLGAAQLGAKKYSAAVPPLEKAITLAPQNAQAEAYLAWAYFGLKDSKAFVTHAGKAKALGHKEPTLLDYLGRVEKGEAIK